MKPVYWWGAPIGDEYFHYFKDVGSDTIVTRCGIEITTLTDNAKPWQLLMRSGVNRKVLPDGLLCPECDCRNERNECQPKSVVPHRRSMM